MGIHDRRPWDEIRVRFSEPACKGEAQNWYQDECDGHHDQETLDEVRVRTCLPANPVAPLWYI